MTLEQTTSRDASTESIFELSYTPDAVAVGASLGNEACYVRTDTAAGLDHLWVAKTGRWYFGRAGVRFLMEGFPLRQNEIVFAPASVRAVFFGKHLTVPMRLFVPPGEEARVYLWAQLQNNGDGPRTVVVEGEGILHAQPSKMHRRQPGPEDIQRRFAPTENPHRVAGPDGEYLSILTSGSPVRIDVDAGVWTWREEISLPPHTTREIWLCLSVEEAERPLPPPNPKEAWASAYSLVEHDALTGLVRTPEPLLDAGVFWGKMNARRVCHRFAAGTGFTNDPPGSIVVTRDAAWFTFGADYFMPDFCRRMLDTLTQFAPYPDGKIAEYLDLNTYPPLRSDYGLNIADPTPLYLLAVYHHAATTGDQDWLRRVYPTLRHAANYLLSQVRDGLVVCTSRETTPGAGQAGWRNVLNGIRITGALAELQAECAAAIRACAEMAAFVGDDSCAWTYEHEAGVLEQALLMKLVDRDTDRFRLALDPDDPNSDYGRDDTLDQVIPLLYCPCDRPLAQRTVQHILRPAYRTPHGLRTVPRNSPTYHPYNQFGLVGGIWPNSVAWAAAAMAPYAPEEAVSLAAGIARGLFPKKPKAWGALVPGEFPEWLDGDSGVSKGMAMSPWMPPTYVWLVVERLIGLTPTLAGLEIKPHLPPQWRGAFVRNLRYHGEHLSLLITPRIVYTTRPPSRCDREVQVGEDVTDQYTYSPDVIVLRYDRHLVAYHAPTSGPATPLPAPLSGLRAGELRLIG